MVHRLRPVAPVVDYNSEPIFQALVLGHLLGDVHEVPQELLLVFTGLAELGEPVTNLGDHQEVGGGLGIDILEGQRLIILVQHGGWDLFVDDLIEDGGRAAVRSPAGRGRSSGSAALSGVRNPDQRCEFSHH